MCILSGLHPKELAEGTPAWAQRDIMRLEVYSEVPRSDLGREDIDSGLHVSEPGGEE